MTTYINMCFDGLVGPTHHFGGHAWGNIASMKHEHMVSSPQKAALEGLNKMKSFLIHHGKQGILPPHERPHLPTLRALGFTGNDYQVIEQAAKEAPEIFYRCCSSSSMWAANAATITPSLDSTDQKVHITPANLTSNFHRSIETEMTAKILKLVFHHSDNFVHHIPLPSVGLFGDEGAANQIRFSNQHSSEGVHLFVYGRKALTDTGKAPQKFPGRQTLEASQAIARNHQLKHVIFAQQNPEAIDAGVFHNDVISMGTESLFLYHEDAFIDTDKVINQLDQVVKDVCNCNLIAIKISRNELSLESAVASYLFNSQFLSNEGHHTILAPMECSHIPSASKTLDTLFNNSEAMINDVQYVSLKESMFNGGGPACLRIRVVLNEQEYNTIPKGVLFTDERENQLLELFKNRYRDQLSLKDLTDPQLLDESRTTLDELTQILKLGSIYAFQK